MLGKRQTNSEIETEQARLLFDSLPIAFTINILLSVILAFVQSSAINPEVLHGWLGLLAAILLARALLFFWWRPNSKRTDYEPHRWINRFRISAIATGMTWGVASVLLFPDGNIPHQVFLAFVLAGLSAGALTSLSVDLVSALGFIMPILLSLIVRMSMEDAAIPHAMALMSGLFTIFLIGSAIRFSNYILDNIRLRIDSRMRENSMILSALELELAREQAEAGSRAKSEFLTSMSHELRTPLNAILGYSQLINTDENLPSGSREQGEEIERAGKHMLDLINGLIDLAQIESGKLDLTIEMASLNKVFADSLSIIKPLAEKNDIQLIAPNHVSDRIEILADYVRLRQILINLLSNAIKYNRPQGYVNLGYQINDGRVRISVSDSGQGIPEHMRERVFNPFDRLGKEQGTIEGTGVGLAITKRIVEAMGGEIGFDSTDGEGTTFWVEFPVSQTRS